MKRSLTTFVKLYLIALLLIIPLLNCKTQTLQEALATLPPAEVQALQAITAQADLTVDNLRLIGRYGYVNNPNSVAIVRGHVVTLRLSDSNLSNLDKLADLTELTILWLPNNKISKLSGLDKLNKLEELLLDKNQLTAINGLENCSALSKLSIKENQMQSMPAIKIANLEELDLSGNKIKDFVGFDGHPKLETLTLDNNYLSSLLGLQGLPNLTTLNINNNQLANFDGFKPLESLVNLNAKKNQLTNIEALTEFPKLLYLDLRDNQIAKQPKNRPKLRWSIKAEGNPPPDNWVEERPGYSWSGGDPYGVSYGGTPLDRSAFEFKGTITKVTKIRPVTIPAILSADPNHVNLDLSVEKGRVRVYLLASPEDHRDSLLAADKFGYNFCDVTPDKPCSLKGSLDLMNMSNDASASFVIENLDGEAENLKFRAWRQ